MRSLYAFRHDLGEIAEDLVDDYMASDMFSSIEGRAVHASWQVESPYPYRYAKVKSSSEDHNRIVSH